MKSNYSVNNISGEKIAVYDNGNKNKDTILFLHGNSSSAICFSQQFEDERLNKFRLVSIDLPGHGASGKTEDAENTYSFKNLSLLIQNLIQELNLQHAIVAAHSLGAHLVMQNPGSKDEFKGAFLFGYPPVSQLSDFFICGTQSPALAMLFKNELTEEELDIFAKEMSTIKREEIKDNVRKTDPLFRTTLYASLANTAIHDEVKAIEKFNNPVAIIHFECDIVVTKDYLSTKEINNFYQKKFFQIKGASHFGFIEQPEEFNTLLVGYAESIFAQ